jgi:hypothetical protein
MNDQLIKRLETLEAENELLKKDNDYLRYECEVGIEALTKLLKKYNILKRKLELKEVEE